MSENKVTYVIYKTTATGGTMKIVKHCEHSLQFRKKNISVLAPRKKVYTNLPKLRYEINNCIVDNLKRWKFILIIIVRA